MKLREMVLKDFGKDRSISGSFGWSSGDPIILTTKNAMDAATTQLEVARCVHGVIHSPTLETRRPLINGQVRYHG